MTFSLNNLQLRINQKNIICDRLSVTIQPGEIWAILGKNGVGKTSFLHGISGIRSLTTGTVSYQSIDVLQTAPCPRAKIIGLLQQEQEYFFPTSVREIVLAGRYPHTRTLQGEAKIDFEITAAILNQLDLHLLAERCITTLSGGEKRRAAIGTLLVQNPTVFLLDEPSNHLDIHYQIKILEIFKTLARKKQKIIIMTTHDMNLAAKYADKIMLFFENAHVITGDKKKLLTSEQLSKLYTHPIQVFSYEEQDYFFA